MRAFSVWSVAMILSGCASLMDGTTQVVTFNSTPAGAEIIVGGASVGVTPVSTQIKRSKNTIVTARKEGFSEQQVTLQTKLNSTFWGNFLTGGFFGSTTDEVSGAAIEYAPNTYFITLPPIEPKPEQKSRFERERRIREFALQNLDRLQRDVSTGRGEYLDALFYLMRVRDTESRASVLRMARSWLMSSDDGAEMAQALARIGGE